MSVKNLTLGCDPEVFFVKNGVPFSCAEKLPGNKKAPYFWKKGFAIQWDNVTCEFNVPPTKTSKGFQSVIKQSLDYITEQWAKRFGCEIDICGSKIFPKSELTAKGAKAFGCDPDFNIWTLRENPRPKAKNKQLRSAGGHIGFGLDDAVDHVWFIRAADLIIGCPSIIFDTDVQRRELYGKAGAFRRTPWGMEYRTPSNFWIRDPGLIDWIHHSAHDIYRRVANGFTIPIEDAKKIIACINNSDKDLLRELTIKYNLKY